MTTKKPTRAELLEALRAVLPYAESRAEDIREDEGVNPETKEAVWAKVTAATKLLTRADAPQQARLSVAAEQRIADKIDGYDRDDLGESGDY